MPTVRLRDAAEYPPEAQRLFELSKAWFNHDFAQPPAMSPGEFTRAEKEMVAAAVSGASACEY